MAKYNTWNINQYKQLTYLTTVIIFTLQTRLENFRGFRSFYGFRGFRYLADVSFKWISTFRQWISYLSVDFDIQAVGFRRYCGFRFLRRPLLLSVKWQLSVSWEVFESACRRSDANQLLLYWSCFVQNSPGVQDLDQQRWNICGKSTLVG